MKRSEVNHAIEWAKELLKKNNVTLPAMAYWDMDTWKENEKNLDTVHEVMLGWDITDFGAGDFDKIGSVFYTVRNGSIKDPSVGVPYCEKYIVMKDGQRLPEHYHVLKTEDIINRAGDGILQVFLWNADQDGNQLDTDVEIYMDGIKHVVKAGEPVLVYPGCSLSITPYIAHIFGPLPGSGDLIVGEVSKVNDDNTDNYWLEQTYRFSKIEEDEAIEHPLCNEYHVI